MAVGGRDVDFDRANSLDFWLEDEMRRSGWPLPRGFGGIAVVRLDTPALRRRVFVGWLGVTYFGGTSSKAGCVYSEGETSSNAG